jgi:hypothetical protein
LLPQKTWATTCGAFSKPRELAAWVATRTLWIQNSDGSGAYPLTSAGAGVYQPVWSKDGDHVLYVRDNALWIIGADSGQPEKVLGLFPEGRISSVFTVIFRAGILWHGISLKGSGFANYLAENGLLLAAT